LRRNADRLLEEFNQESEEYKMRKLMLGDAKEELNLSNENQVEEEKKENDMDELKIEEKEIPTIITIKKRKKDKISFGVETEEDEQDRGNENKILDEEEEELEEKQEGMSEPVHNRIFSVLDFYKGGESQISDEEKQNFQIFRVPVSSFFLSE